MDDRDPCCVSTTDVSQKVETVTVAIAPNTVSDTREFTLRTPQCTRISFPIVKLVLFALVCPALESRSKQHAPYSGCLFIPELGPTAGDAGPSGEDTAWIETRLPCACP